MNMKKTGKVLVLLGASAALIASLVNDKKLKHKEKTIIRLQKK